jgi:probable rRNA maturation factor
VIIDIDNRSTFEIDLKKINQIAYFIMKKLDLPSGQEVSISFADEAEMTQLHQQWMGEPGPTDVMSFRLDGIAPGDSSLGDVIICPQVALRDATQAKRSPAFHLTFLLVHGMLHLTGWDHQKKLEKFKMKRRESHLMTAITSEFNS